MKKVLLIGVIMVLLVGCNTASSKKDIIESGTKCAIISEDFVKAKLKYPEESDFKTRGYVHEVEGSTAIILNKFTAKNSFGVNVSYTYKIWLEFYGGEWEVVDNWRCKKLIIEGSDGSVESF